jgi:predicted nucleic acid-binding protein
MPASFFDTNVLIYLTLEDDAKAERAERLIAGGGTISVQVLNEIVNVARRKRQLPWSQIRDVIATLQTLLSVEPLTIDAHLLGLRVADRYQLATYDAMIVASALLAECDTLWSEDMQDGLVVDEQLVIRNPFRAR